MLGLYEFIFFLQISTNGFISFRFSYNSFIPQRFPVRYQRIVAPYWTDIDLSKGGRAIYDVITSGSLLQPVNNFISCDQSMRFGGIMMLAVRFINVPHRNHPGVSFATV